MKQFNSLVKSRDIDFNNKSVPEQLELLLDRMNLFSQLKMNAGDRYKFIIFFARLINSFENIDLYLKRIYELGIYTCENAESFISLCNDLFIAFEDISYYLGAEGIADIDFIKISNTFLLTTSILPHNYDLLIQAKNNGLNPYIVNIINNFMIPFAILKEHIVRLKLIYEENIVPLLNPDTVKKLNLGNVLVYEYENLYMNAVTVLKSKPKI